MITNSRPNKLGRWTRIAVICQIGAAILGNPLSNTLKATESKRPNILWLTVEDISPYLGAYCHPNAHTPHLDQLAEQGIRYTQVYANAPVCAVARSALLTGMHSPAAGQPPAKQK